MIKNNYIDLLHSFREGATAVELEKNLQALIESKIVERLGINPFHGCLSTP